MMDVFRHLLTCLGSLSLISSSYSEGKGKFKETRQHKKSTRKIKSDFFLKYGRKNRTDTDQLKKCSSDRVQTELAEQRGAPCSFRSLGERKEREKKKSTAKWQESES